MAPDLNSLPTSRPPSTTGSPLSQRPRRISLNSADISRPSPPSPRSPSLSSLQAAASINAGLQRPRLDSNHRRSSLMNNFSLNDPAIPGPGEMQLSNGGTSPSPGSSRRSLGLHIAGTHQRQPSLGELHQELENEQEAQVNRLLHMIRVQQDQLANMQRQQHQTQDSSIAVVEQNSTLIPPNSNVPNSVSAAGHIPYRPTSLSRQSSHRLSHAESNSRGTSPRPLSPSNLIPSSDEPLPENNRDECAFYQAETQMLTRENQMLKHRIRELERQIAEMSSSPPMTTTATHNSSNAFSASSPLAIRSETLPEPVPTDTDPAVKAD